MKKKTLSFVAVLALSVIWLSNGSTLDPILLNKAKQEYKAKGNKLKNKRYITVIDFRKSILQERLWVYDTKSHSIVLSSRVSHAFKSGLLYPTAFSNKEGSEKSCYGSFITGEAYKGEWGYAMGIDGVSPTNTKARSRSIVMHPGATFSKGCFMTLPSINERLINLTKDKSLVVVYK